MEEIYDLIIIGAGPAGIAAGIYAKNFGLKCLIIGEKGGGLINVAYKVENYPGIFNLTGEELSQKFIEHLNYLHISLIAERTKEIKQEKNIFGVVVENEKYSAKTLILAMGTEIKKLEIKNIEKLEGKSVSYKISDDVFLYKNKIVGVIGGANSAAMVAVKLAEQAEKVYLIYRKDKLRADAIWVGRLDNLKNIEIIYSANAVELKGEKKLESIILDNGQELAMEELFIEAGTVPDSVLIKSLGIKTNEHGYIEVNKDQSTNIDGIFAAGDITNASNGFRQIVTACSEGAIAALGAFNFLKKK